MTKTKTEHDRDTDLEMNPLACEVADAWVAFPYGAKGRAQLAATEFGVVLDRLERATQHSALRKVRP